MEKWKAVEGYEGLYSVSNLGNVRREAYSYYTPFAGNINVPEKTLTPSINKGYLRIKLQKEGVGTNHFIHRLVGNSFLTKVDGKDEINHKNGVKSDNRAVNLEWCTSQENMKHAYTNGLMSKARGEKAGSSKLTEEKVLFIRNNKTDYTQKELGNMFGVSQSVISDVLTKKSWTHISR